MSEEKAGWKDRLFGGLKKTSSKLTDNITGLVTKAKLDAGDLDEIEDALIASDLGPAMAAQIRKKLPPDVLKKVLMPKASGKLWKTKLPPFWRPSPNRSTSMRFHGPKLSL